MRSSRVSPSRTSASTSAGPLGSVESLMTGIFETRTIVVPCAASVLGESTMRTLFFGSLVASVLVATSADAHHSFGTFLMNENIELKGVVAKLDYVNPHSWLHLTATGPDGKTAEYKCEMRSATTLRRSGWTLEMFAPGTGVTVQGAPDRVDPHSCYVSTLVLADGTQLDRYGQRVEAKVIGERAARSPSGEPNLAG